MIFSLCYGNDTHDFSVLEDVFLFKKYDFQIFETYKRALIHENQI